MNPDTDFSYEERMTMCDKKCNDKIVNLVYDLMNELNAMGQEAKVGEYFVNAIRNTHCTLQQNLFRNILVPVIKDFAKRYDEGNFDARNEASCKCAKDILPIIKDVGFPFI